MCAEFGLMILPKFDFFELVYPWCMVPSLNRTDVTSRGVDLLFLKKGIKTEN